MTRVKYKTFFALHWLSCDDEIITKYKNWRTLEELRRWEEFIKNNFEKEKKAFFNLQNLD